MEKFKVSITGSGLGDFVYNNVDFSSVFFRKYQSISSGDGGLEPGKLVFKQELEAFAGRNLGNILDEIVGKKSYDTFNLGGPALVSMINATQLLSDSDVEISFYGARGNDEKGDAMLELLHKLPVNLSHYHVFQGETPYTDVLSDPHYAGGKGERIFVNNIGCSSQYKSTHLDENFWNSNMIVFGATALVPQIHTELTSLLAKAKENNAFTLVHTVYDFLNEKLHPRKPWPLGDTLKSLPLIDLLIMDYEEAQRISGATTFDEACCFFKKNSCGAFIITHGANPTYIYSSGKIFTQIETIIPVCDWISKEFENNPELKGDTTGCGDNFAGAVISSVVKQLKFNPEKLSLFDATILGTASGGFACYYVGGTYFEKKKGEKISKINSMVQRLLSNESIYMKKSVIYA